jgi:hypothetical protein
LTSETELPEKQISNEKDHDSRLVKVLKAIDQVGSGGARRSDIEDATEIFWDLPEMLERITRWGLIKVVHSNYWNWYYLTDSGREYLRKKKEDEQRHAPGAPP